MVATASTGYWPGRALGGQHHRIRAVVDGGRHVRDLGAGRDRRGDHRFEHLGRDDHGLAEPAGGADDALLDARHLLQRHLDAEIAAGHHHGVGDLHDLVEARDRLGLLELRHDERAAPRHLPDLGDVLGPLHEGERDPVDPGIEGGLEVRAVLLGHGRRPG